MPTDRLIPPEGYSMTTSSVPCRHRPALVPELSKARSYERRRHAGLRTAEAKANGKEVVMATGNGGLLRGDCDKTLVVVGGGADTLLIPRGAITFVNS